MRFEKYIQIKTSINSPRGARSVAMTGLASKRIIDVKQFATAKQIGLIVKKHYKKMRGKCAPFGNITGYHFMTSERKYTAFDVDGKIVED
jgi:hypothetical protein